MSERLYSICVRGWHIEVGRAGNRQVLLGHTYRNHYIVAHWFADNGQFLELERVKLSLTPPTFPGTTIFRPDPAYDRHKAEQRAAFKARVGFEEADIKVHRFESEEACILDLPGDCEEFLRSPDAYSSEDRQNFERQIARFRGEGWFVLVWPEEYWFSADGRCIAT